MTEEINRIKEVYEDRAKKPKIDYNPLLPQNYYTLASREKLLISLLNKYFGTDMSSLKFLDIGFGSGVDLLTIIKSGFKLENISGTEVLADRFNAVKGLIPGANLVLSKGFSLPFETESMDLIIQSTVFSSILDSSSRLELASEMYRVLKPGGYIFSYDLRFNNPWNKNVLKIDKKEIYSLFPKGSHRFYPVTLNPLLARKIAPVSIILCEVMEIFSFLCSHYYTVISKN